MACMSLSMKCAVAAKPACRKIQTRKTVATVSMASKAQQTPAKFFAAKKAALSMAV
eukprot:CAMPEP_0197609436 /NCGR_PEP_ID=MMETSP1326-20131121/51211_1 /TAXON_ID=1155430 /ORGANISM="Genus nov. species nov., Strain RCC2288" /LENGTH=55 /DNA_ID=CAMNT_0043177809 /DNA_START=640 /DNA_END=804 /DNA_ORIENTATION=-